jgi:hypothetical protein
METVPGSFPGWQLPFVLAGVCDFTQSMGDSSQHWAFPLFTYALTEAIFLCLINARLRLLRSGCSVRAAGT